MLVSGTALASKGSVPAAMAASDLGLATVTGFLNGESACRIADGARNRSDYEDIYGLVPNDAEGWIDTRGREVSREEYLRAPFGDRYFRCQSTRSWSYNPGSAEKKAFRGTLAADPQVSGFKIARKPVYA